MTNPSAGETSKSTADKVENPTTTTDLTGTPAAKVPASLAAESPNQKILQAVRDGRDADVRVLLGLVDGGALTEALFQALCNRKTTAAAILVKHGKGIKLHNKYGPLHRTVLHEATAARRHRDISRSLLRLAQAARYVNIKDQNGRTALHEAAAQGDVDIVRDLLKRGAHIDETDNELLTPLHTAVNCHASRHDQGHKVEEWLLEYGADVNTKDDRSEWP
jgi:hypothetical protein